MTHDILETQLIESLVTQVFDPHNHDTEDFPLRDVINDCIELRIRFPGGYSTVSGRVRFIPGRGGAADQICIGESSLPADAIVRRESVGYDFVFDSTKYHSH